MTVTVRRIGAEEAAPLRELRLRALSDAPRAFSATLAGESARPFAYWVAMAGRRATSPTEATFIAVSPAGDWVGLAGGYVESVAGSQVGAGAGVQSGAGRANLISMWVAPEQRGGGTAAALVTAVAGWARAGGHATLDLWVVEDNARAFAFYRRCGFEVTDDRETFPNDPCVEEIRMRLALT